MCAKPVKRLSGWRRALRVLLLTLLPPLFLGLVAGTVLWVRSGKTFRLREWTITGAALADRTRLARVLESVRGEPLALVNLDSLKLGLAADPWITGMRLTKNWPDALMVELVEDEPLTWVIQDSRVRCLAASGRLLPMPRSGVSLDMPVLAGAPVVLRAASAELVGLKHDFPVLYGRLERLEWGSTLVLHLRGATPRVLMQPAQWRHGLSMLQVITVLRPELLARGGELDLRFVNQVVWRSGNV